MSEVILLGAGTLIFVILMLILVLALTQPSALEAEAPAFQNPQPPVAALWLRRNGEQSVPGAFDNQMKLLKNSCDVVWTLV